jgi:spoIIIJ-associated protein
MTETRPSLEIIAPTVEEAVARGASELGVGEDQVQVEILDEGTRGVMGMGARQARVRLTMLAEQRPASSEEVEDAGDPGLRSAREVVEKLLSLMGADGRVTARWATEFDPDLPRPILVDVQGKDLSLLIGRRGETLRALQYITRLITSRELGESGLVVIDVEGYRARREQQLRRLARNMAEQAKQTGRTLSLEPMPAFERRIIHLELRDDADVTTESVGEGDSRKVTIIPKR